MVWPIVCRGLEELPNINAMQLFEELRVQFPGRFTPKQYKTLVRRVNRWRQEARARGVVIGPKTYRRLSDKPRGRRPDIFKDHWEEMVQCLEEWPDQTALELLVEFQARYPARYSLRRLYTLQLTSNLNFGKVVVTDQSSSFLGKNMDLYLEPVTPEFVAVASGAGSPPLNSIPESR
jgi:hypothetical protein